MNLQDFFDGLTVEQVAEMISSGQEEHLTLDFKRVSGSDLGNSDDRKNFAKALSGFANSSGGIIIWGVVADQKNAAGIDYAYAAQEIPDLKKFLTRLNEFTGSYVSPLVEGVRHRILPTTAHQGFAATLVPESDSGPHMAKGGEYRYYKRSGDSFYRMEHFDIEDMFGRRRKPTLSLETRVVQAGGLSSGGVEEINGRAVLSIRNTGRGIARAPFLSFEINPLSYRRDDFGLTGNRGEGLPRLPHAGPSNLCRYGAGLDTVIHPGTLHDVAAVAVTVVRRNGEVTPVEDLRLRYTIAAEGARSVSAEVTVSGDEIVKALVPGGSAPR